MHAYSTGIESERASTYVCPLWEKNRIQFIFWGEKKAYLRYFILCPSLFGARVSALNAYVYECCTMRSPDEKGWDAKYYCKYKGLCGQRKVFTLPKSLVTLLFTKEDRKAHSKKYSFSQKGLNKNSFGPGKMVK